MIIINLLNLYHKNCISVFEAIQEGYDLATTIVKKTNLGTGTVSQILNELVNQKLITYELIPSKRNGQLKYSINKDAYILYIEKRGKQFHFISISPYGDALNNFKFPIEYEYLNPTYSLHYIISTLRYRENFENCKGIYISDSNLDDMNVIDTDIKIINVFQMLVDKYTNDSEINFIEYLDKKVLIVYSKIHYTDCNYEDIQKILNIDNHIVYDEDKKYDYIFDCLTSISQRAVKNHIYTIQQKEKNKHLFK